MIWFSFLNVIRYNSVDSHPSFRFTVGLVHNWVRFLQMCDGWQPSVGSWIGVVGVLPLAATPEFDNVDDCEDDLVVEGIWQADLTVTYRWPRQMRHWYTLYQRKRTHNLMNMVVVIGTLLTKQPPKKTLQLSPRRFSNNYKLLLGLLVPLYCKRLL